ncbi:MAG TPA: YggT family protein [Coriobacteriia bacterium]|nr:YggT family protein [Coriobacteriia bacterium]
MSIARVINGLVSFYSLAIFAYVILSWFRPKGMLYDIYRVLGQICEPYIGVFRKIVPLVGGGIDFSPWVAVLVLQYLIRPVLVTLLGNVGL